MNVLAYPVGLYNDEVVRITGNTTTMPLPRKAGIIILTETDTESGGVYKKDDRIDTFISKVEGSYYKE